MKVTNLCFDDYANLAYNNAMALQSVGVECISLKRRKHAFGYANESKVAGTSQMIEACRDADVVQIFHSWDFANHIGLKDKKKVIWHTGTTYRLNPKKWNAFFNPIVDMTITDQCEFMHLGAKNIHYMATAIDTDKIMPIEREIKAPYKIGHYPSNPDVKGTAAIIEMVGEVMKLHPGKFTFDCDTKILPHEENLKRIGECDIYFELFAPTQHGKEYGCFGVTAFEAAAMGCVVITQNSYPDVYSHAYGMLSPFWLAHSKKQFFDIIHLLIHEENYFFKEMATKNDRKIIKRQHSYQATGARMKMLLEKII